MGGRGPKSTGRPPRCGRLDREAASPEAQPWQGPVDRRAGGDLVCDRRVGRFCFRSRVLRRRGVGVGPGGRSGAGGGSAERRLGCGRRHGGGGDPSSRSEVSSARPFDGPRLPRFVRSRVPGRIRAEARRPGRRRVPRKGGKEERIADDPHQAPDPPHAHATGTGRFVQGQIRPFRLD